MALKNLTVVELREKAKHIKGYSKMNKDALISALSRKKRGGEPKAEAEAEKDRVERLIKILETNTTLTTADKTMIEEYLRKRKSELEIKS